MRPNPIDLPLYDYVITRADGRGFDLAVEVCCEKCAGPSLTLTGVTVDRLPRGARRLDVALPCDCPTWHNRLESVVRGAGFVAACALAYVFVCGMMLL
jgi:hypothetical protein